MFLSCAIDFFLILGPVQDTLCFLSFGMCGVLGLIAYCLFVWNLGTCRLMELCYVFCCCDVLWFEIGCVFSVLVGVVFWSFAPLSPLGGCVRHTVCGTLLLCRRPLHPPSDNRSQKLPITTRGVTTEADVDFL